MKKLIPCSMAAAVCMIASVAPAAEITYTDLYTLTTTGTVLTPMMMHGTDVVGYSRRNIVWPIDNLEHLVVGASIWSPDHPEGVSLIPDGYELAISYGLTGTQQVGVIGQSLTSSEGYATLWTGTADSAVNLHPTGYTYSQATATDGTQQGGKIVGAATGDKEHAALWQGTADSFIDLNPAGFTMSEIFAVGSGHQVGLGRTAESGAQTRALLWSGTAESAVNLHPDGYANTQATGLLGDVQVGYAQPTGSKNHAVLWHGTAESMIDLNGDLYSSHALDLNEQGLVAGFGSTADATSVRRALVWDVNSGTRYDLHSVLPANIKLSMALDIDGNTVYGLAQDTQNKFHAIMWTLPVPEPMSLGLLAMGGLMLNRRRRPNSSDLQTATLALK